MANTNAELTNLLRREAKKAGIDSATADKTAKMLKKGKINLGMLAPHLTQALTDRFRNNQSDAPTHPLTREELLERSRARRKVLSSNRTSKFARELDYQKTKERIEERRQTEQEERERNERNRVKKHKQKLRDLEKKIGQVSTEFYHQCLLKLKDNKFDRPDQKHNASNIIELYQKQNNLSNNKLEMSQELEHLLVDEDLSDLELD